jgi:hypothetical protein
VVFFCLLARLGLAGPSPSVVEGEERPVAVRIPILQRAPHQQVAGLSHEFRHLVRLAMQKIPAYIKDNLSEPDGNPLTLPDKVAATGENAQAPTIKTDTVRPQNPFLSERRSHAAEDQMAAQATVGVGIIQGVKVYQKPSANLFTAECYSPAGEKIYVGMELVDEQNLLTASLYGTGGRSLVREVANVLTRAMGGCQPSETTEKQLAILGIQNRNHVRELSEKPSTVEFYKNRGEQMMIAVHGASSGFYPSASGKHYITYASSLPIPENGLFASLPSEYSGGSNEDDFLRFFRENYGHLIMSVGTRLDHDGESFENRGVVRNPISMLEGDFKEIAIPVVHGFSAVIVANEFGRTKFKVHALPEMHKRFISVLPSSEIIRSTTNAVMECDLEAKLGTLQQSFLAQLSPQPISTEPVVVACKKKN